MVRKSVIQKNGNSTLRTHMAQTVQGTNREEWLKVLGKGMITLPKKWRDEMGIENGDVVKAVLSALAPTGGSAAIMFL
jgi:antidote-toxin recognition MazE-like antitoxin